MATWPATSIVRSLRPWPAPTLSTMVEWSWLTTDVATARSASSGRETTGSSPKSEPVIVISPPAFERLRLGGSTEATTGGL